MKKEFRIPDITRLFGINRNSVQQYLDRGLIEASVQRSTKKGQPNIFSLLDLCAVRLFQKLIENSFSWKTAHAVSSGCRNSFFLTGITSVRISNITEIRVNLGLIENDVLGAINNE